jgi:hypothetical protein
VIGAVIVLGVAYDVTARRFSLVTRLRSLFQHPEKRVAVLPAGGPGGGEGGDEVLGAGSDASTPNQRDEEKIR